MYIRNVSSYIIFDLLSFRYFDKLSTGFRRDLFDNQKIASPVRKLGSSLHCVPFRMNKIPIMSDNGQSNNKIKIPIELRFNRDFLFKVEYYLICSTFCTSSIFTLSKKPCSLIHSSENTLLIYREP